MLFDLLVDNFGHVFFKDFSQFPLDAKPLAMSSHSLGDFFWQFVWCRMDGLCVETYVSSWVSSKSFTQPLNEICEDGIFILFSINGRIRCKVM